MPTLNQAGFINAAIDSVLGQDYPSIELIVADGGSTDGTLELLKNRQAIDSRLRWFSQPDNGPAEAINNALSNARGTIIGWLNSDDLYAPGAITRAVNCLQLNARLLMVYGLGQHVNGEGRYLSDYPTLPPTTSVKQFSEGCFICQPTVFFRRTMPLLLGQLDESLKTAFDFDYWLRAFIAFQARIGFVNEVQAYSRLHEDCITLRMRRTVTLEGMQLLAKYLGYAPKEWLLTYVDEILNRDVLSLGITDARRDIHTLLDETAILLSNNDFIAVKDSINKDSRFNQWEYPEASNLFAPTWTDKTFLSAVSLGTFCHAAEILKHSELRMFSGPFDWLFTNLAVVTHCIEDDFTLFLDKSKYQTVPLEERLVPDANICDHSFYRDQFGIKYFFNHHNPTQDLVYGHFQRSVERFRQLHAHSPVLFLMVTHLPVLAADYEHLVELLEKSVGNFLLVVVRFISESQKNVTTFHHKHNFISINFSVVELSNGVVFPEEIDNLRFEAFIRSFRVIPDSFTKDTNFSMLQDSSLQDDAKSVDFIEASYLAANPDVKIAIETELFKSGLDHFERYGRDERRRLSL